MKLVFTIALILLTFVSGAQEFMGVKVEGDKATLISKFKAKGFIVTLAASIKNDNHEHRNNPN
jgi:hypothetical protein